MNSVYWTICISVCITEGLGCFIWNCPQRGKRVQQHQDMLGLSQCFPCGPLHLGRCVSEAHCNHPALGVIPSTECGNEDKINRPCFVRGRGCSSEIMRYGRCVTDTTCCGEGGCLEDSSCVFGASSEDNMDNRQQTVKRAWRIY